MEKNREQSSSARISVISIIVKWCEDRAFLDVFLKEIYIHLSINIFSKAALPVVLLQSLHMLPYFLKMKIFAIAKY